jgi:2-desacetyl-2-hydroxyethyl bacteriochlorophyllide A dehydrogenase
MLKASFYVGNETIETGACAPIEPGPGQVQIRVSHVGICGTDLHVVRGKMDHRVTFPQVLGHEMSGTIAAAGPGAGDWKPGDRVTVMPLDPCRQCPACAAGHSHICMNLKFIGIDAPGALQSLWTVPAHTLHRLPETLSLEQGALIEPVAVACHDVRLGQVAPGDFAVVLGGGPIGTLVALVARSRGARVLVSEINPYRLELARALGLDAVNPLETSLPALVGERTAGAGADVIFEVSGSQDGAEIMTQLARTRGRIVIVAIFPQPPRIDLFRFFWRELRLCGARVYEHQDFEAAIRLAESGALPLDRLISARRPIEDVAQAVHQLERGGEVMKILIEVAR